MFYFTSEVRNINFLLYSKNRLFNKKKNLFLFNIGDVVAIIFTKAGYYFLFEGLCLAIRKKKLKSPEATFIICNVLAGVSLELTISYYQHMGFILKTVNTRFNKISVGRSKLHYLSDKFRNKLTKSSRLN